MELADDIQGASLDLLVDPSDVLAHHPEHGELDAAEEEDDDHQRSPARNDVGAGQLEHDGDEAGQERDEGD